MKNNATTNLRTVVSKNEVGTWDLAVKSGNKTLWATDYTRRRNAVRGFNRLRTNTDVAPAAVKVGDKFIPAIDCGSVFLMDTTNKFAREATAISRSQKVLEAVRLTSLDIQ